MIEQMNQAAFWAGMIVAVGGIILRAEMGQRFPTPAFAVSILAGVAGTALGAR